MHKEVAERDELLGGELPPIGNSPYAQGGSTTLDKHGKGKYRIRYFVANMSDENDVLMVESIMSASVACRDKPVKPGDVMVIKEETNFDREGNYNILIKYMELADPTSTATQPTAADNGSDKEKSSTPSTTPKASRKKQAEVALAATKEVPFTDMTPPSPDAVLIDDTPALVPAARDNNDSSGTGHYDY